MSKVCGYFGYSRSAYYDWRQNSLKEETGQLLVLAKVRQIRRGHPRMGCRKLYHLLRGDIEGIGLSLGRDRFFDLLRQEGLLVKRKKKYMVTTQSFSRYSQFGDHFNGKTLTGPHQAWVSDITYIAVAKTFRYLYLITDAYSRKVVGWYLGDTLEAKCALEALKMAIGQCPKTEGLVHHSDRGFQYCSKIYTALLAKAGIISSMGEAGNCYDNAMAERVNGILKIEYLLDGAFKDIHEVIAATKHAVKFYNGQRPHLSLSMKNPSEVHQGNSVFSIPKRKSSSSRGPVKAK